MGIAMGSSPEEVLNAVGWRRPTSDRIEASERDMGAGTPGVAAAALAALGPLVMIGLSQGLGAGLIIVATAIAGASSLTKRRTAPLPTLAAVPSLAVIAGSILLADVSLGVRIGAAVLGLMLAGAIVAMLWDRR